MKRSAAFLALLALVFTAVAGWVHPQLYEVPILMYHRVDIVRSSKPDSTIVSPAAFERQMEFLKVHDYHVLSLTEIAKQIKEGQIIPAKTVAITFDDGTLDNFRNAFPVLKKMKFPATIFMITDNIGREGWLSDEDLRILDESGVAIGSHTASHAFLPDSEPVVIARELSESKQKLEGILGHPVTLFSYPAGGVTSSIERQVSDVGYEAAVTTNYHTSRRDIFALHRVKVSESSGNLFNFWIKVSGYYHLGKKRIVRKT